MSPREAERLERHNVYCSKLLGKRWKMPAKMRSSSRGARIGVFVGVWLSDFEARLFANPENVDFYMTTGSGRYAASGRISYALQSAWPELDVGYGMFLLTCRRSSRRTKASGAAKVKWR